MWNGCQAVGKIGNIISYQFWWRFWTICHSYIRKMDFEWKQIPSTCHQRPVGPSFWTLSQFWWHWYLRGVKHPESMFRLERAAMFTQKELSVSFVDLYGSRFFCGTGVHLNMNHTFEWLNIWMAILLNMISNPLLQSAWKRYQEGDLRVKSNTISFETNPCNDSFLHAY